MIRTITIEEDAMDLLIEKIKKDGTVKPGNILKVDNFINHQVDVELIDAMGKDFYDHYKDKPITKVLTLEVSGIPMAYTTAKYFNVPMIFAKKIESLTLSEDVYSSQVTSYTKKKTYNIRVDKRFLNSDDCVLIIDDFLAHGEALKGLIDLCDQAGAEVGGIGIAIEKAFQDGGKLVREQGYEVYSQACIASFDNDTVHFA